ncbi:MAG TPA: hypothetical protein VI814_15485 [Candidatus Limnocylindria bacterium]
MSDDEHERRGAPRRMAVEVQADHRVLHEVPDTLLREIPLLEEGTPLERRREYLDLHDPARADFRAEGIERVKPGQRIVARGDVSDEAWQELRAACDRVARRRPLRRAS